MSAAAAYSVLLTLLLTCMSDVANNSHMAVQEAQEVQMETKCFSPMAAIGGLDSVMSRIVSTF